MNEECFQYEECDAYYSTFIAANKAVFGVEYKGHTADFCPTANEQQLSWLKKNLDLDAWVIPCSNYTYYDDSKASSMIPSFSIAIAFVGLLCQVLY